MALGAEKYVTLNLLAIQHTNSHYLNERFVSVDDGSHPTHRSERSEVLRIYPPSCANSCLLNDE